MRWTVLALALVWAACGPADDLNRPLQPLEVGSSWSYETSDLDGSDAEVKTVKVLRREQVRGIEAVVLESTRGTEVTRVWLAEVDGKIVRLREENSDGATLLDLRDFLPGSLRTPAKLAGLQVGDEIPMPYEEQSIASDGTVLGSVRRTPSMVVEDVDDVVKTPAGEFRCLRLRKLGDDGSDGKQIWYAPGVGKVQEKGGRLEKLKRYDVGD